MNLSISRESRTKRKRELDIFDPIYIPLRKKRCMYKYYQNCQFIGNNTFSPQVGGFASDPLNVFNNVNMKSTQNTLNINRNKNRKRKRKQEINIFD